MTRRYLLLTAFCLLLLFSRLYHLDRTARFTRDESSDLVKMHQYWVDKTITLVGPIDNTGTLVYGSLTYYMLLPFAIVKGFDPIGPALGTAFYSVATGIILLLIAKRLNHKLLVPAGLLIIVWNPLIVSGRWAWNPHLVPFWGSLAVLCYLIQTKKSFFLSGLCLGLMFHHHYIAFASIAGFALPVFITEIIKHRFLRAGLFATGILLTLLPFAVFDLRHPPGLFFSHYLASNTVTAGIGQKFSTYLPKLFDASTFSLTALAPVWLLAIVVGGLMAIVLFLDCKKHRQALLFLSPVIGQLAILPLLPTLELRYFLPAVVFFFSWLVYHRTGIAKKLVQIIIVLLIIGNASIVTKTMTKTMTAPDIYSLRSMANFIAYQIKSSNLKNNNLAVLQSDDREPLGTIYRDVLLIKGITIDNPSAGAYDLTDNLFVISQKSEQIVREDQSNIMNKFRNGPVRQAGQVPASDWKVYLFNRGN